MNQIQDISFLYIVYIIYIYSLFNYNIPSISEIVVELHKILDEICEKKGIEELTEF